jgi:hypothetical protein
MLKSLISSLLNLQWFRTLEWLRTFRTSLCISNEIFSRSVCEQIAQYSIGQRHTKKQKKERRSQKERKRKRGKERKRKRGKSIHFKK